MFRIVPRRIYKSTIMRPEALLRYRARSSFGLIRCLHTETKVPPPSPPLSFVFDIDGVLLRGHSAIPGAKRALDILEGRNSLSVKVPYILLTNGGGTSEQARCRALTDQLGVKITPTQLVQAHTVLKKWGRHADKPVLVLGGKGDEVRKVAEGYGFKDVYTTLDVHAWNPSVWPFHELTPEERASTKKADFSALQISSILVFHDPRNWALDIQIVCDILQSRGIVGGPPYIDRSNIGERGRIGEKRDPVELVFCNPDLLWRAEFDRPRLGQGAFRAAFLAVYKSLTGAEYPYVQYGKPTPRTYAFAEEVLKDRLEELHGHRRLPPVYMVGDNPESDIAGANAARWSSVLVHTGVYDPSQHGPPAHSPTRHAPDVEHAVRWAMEKEIGSV